MRVIITFLGLSPKLTEYEYQGRTYTGEVFAQALRQFCQYDQMLVCVTPEAQANTWSILAELNDPRIKPVQIPKGKTTAEMWETFTTIAQHVQTQDEVIFDITHGLRSLPFLIFLFAAYLKAAKQVSIAAVYYGAYDLGKSGSPAPVIDLSEFVNMLDWLTATNTFLQSGNGQALAQLLQAQKVSGKSVKARKQQQDLQRVADAIAAISLALQMTRSFEVMQATDTLEETVTAAADSLSDCAKPFSLLQDRIVTGYGQFALADADPEANPAQITSCLAKQLDMIGWYIAHQQTIQAATLAYEWFFSAIAHKYSTYEQRNDIKAEKTLKNLLEGKPHRKELLELRRNLRSLRHDLAHAGVDFKYRQNAEVLQTRMKALYERLEVLRHFLIK